MEEEEKIDEADFDFTEIKNCKGLISKLFPDIKMLKHWNKYSIIVYNKLTRYIVVRKPNFWYKLRTTMILPFIFLPYCFWWGYINVKLAIRESYKGSFTVAQGIDEEIYNKIRNYADGANK